MVSQYELCLGTKIIAYDLIRSARTTIGITIKPGGSMIVRAPSNVTDEAIAKVLAQKASWISSKVEALSKSQPLQKERRTFSTGDVVTCAGEHYNLDIQRSPDEKAYASASGTTLLLKVPFSPPTGRPKQTAARAVLVAWYREEARILITRRAMQVAQRIGVEFQRIAIRDQKTKWGSCSSNNNLNFNWRILLAPPPVMDYIIVHEVCHLRVHDHSKAFWKLVGSIVPDYATKRSWLRQNGTSLRL
jgi:hypothetical protein